MNRSNITSFAAVAYEAGEGEVAGCGKTAVLSTYYVVNLVGKPNVVLVDETVFTAMVRAASHFGSELFADVRGHARGSVVPWPWPSSRCVPVPRNGPARPFLPATIRYFFLARATRRLCAGLQLRDGNGRQPPVWCQHQ